MIEGFLHLFKARPWSEVAVDLCDILAVAYIVYRGLLVLRGTRAMQAGIGLGVVCGIYAVSKFFGFVTLDNIFSSLLSSLIVVIVVLFHVDIRRGLVRLGTGSSALAGGPSRQQESRVIEEVVAAATELARHRMGALICLEQHASLDEFGVSPGTVIDSLVHRELLVNLFVPEGVNKLHDGAVVIRNLRIHKAGVFFPMPDTRVLDKSLGSRHRAALGITDETDAVVVVVSEERGTISFCFEGNIVSNLDGSALKKALLGLFGKNAQTKKKPAPQQKKSPVSGQVRAVVPVSERSPPMSVGAPQVPAQPLPPEPPSAPSLAGRMSRAPKPMATARPLETPRPLLASDISPLPGEEK